MRTKGYYHYEVTEDETREAHCLFQSQAYQKT